MRETQDHDYEKRVEYELSEIHYLHQKLFKTTTASDASPELRDALSDELWSQYQELEKTKQIVAGRTRRQVEREQLYIVSTILWEQLDNEERRDYLSMIRDQMKE
jgi:hypothetical protein